MSIDGYMEVRALERRNYNSMTHEQLVNALEGAMAACRIADRQMEDMRSEIADRDADLRTWASAFAPNRALGVRYPPIGA